MSSVKHGGAAQKVSTLRENEKKWTPQLVAAGWTFWPNVFLKYQRELGLTPVQMNVLLQIASNWFKAESNPWRAKASLAKAINLSERQVQRVLADLKARGYFDSDPALQGRPAGERLRLLGPHQSGQALR